MVREGQLPQLGECIVHKNLCSRDTPRGSTKSHARQPMKAFPESRSHTSPRTFGQRPANVPRAGRCDHRLAVHTVSSGTQFSPESSLSSKFCTA
jgi:hypothetical protein